MKVPVSWLRDYVDVEATPSELADKLTFSGIEVEGVQSVGSDLKGIVVAEVLSIDPHPSADRLRICGVSTGAQEVKVVCGADNLAVGSKFPFAGIGVELPGGMKIKEARIRGEASFGMLCAEDELGLSGDHSGLMLLPDDAAPGAPVAQVVGGPDTVLELEVTWNRPDCLCMIGIAREIAALCGSRLKLPDVGFAERGSPVADLTAIQVEDSEGCPRYVARVLGETRTRPSPIWMRRRLQLCGIRPISNIVDITNYVMLECGQPLHAFDYELLREHRIVVRRARPGETMATLDDVERKLDAGMLVIADGVGPVAVAGIMGGAGSEIRTDTRTVLLESACFHAPGIARTSTALGLSTESSHRYERGVDVGGGDWASRRAAALMVAHADAVAASGAIDVYPHPAAVRRVRCRFQRTRDLMGVDLADGEIVDKLKALQFDVAEQDAAACSVRVPSFRGDIRIEADLIEEVARMHGLEEIPEAVPAARIVPDATDAAARSVFLSRRHLIGLGLTETMNYSFVSHALLDLFNPNDREQRVILPNPVSVDYAVLRHSLLPQMVESLGRNLSRQVSASAFFEIGRVFSKSVQGRILEEERVCIGLMGPVGRLGMKGRAPVAREEVFLWLKGLVEAFLDVQQVQVDQMAPVEHPGFEAGWSVAMTGNNRRLGVFGLIAEPVRHEWRMADPAGAAEFLLEPLTRDVAHVRDLRPIPAYPPVTRDLSIIVEESVRHEEIVATIRKSAPRELTTIELFDIFRNEAIGESRKSMTYALVYRSVDRSLTDEDANRYHEQVKRALRNELKAELREG